MPGLGPGIHVFLSAAAKTWMAGPSPAMTSIVKFQTAKWLKQHSLPNRNQLILTL
jgi:hypothetical protein